jgi:hypothetical protein
MCLCDRECQERFLERQEELLRQVRILSDECHAWREISDRYPPASILKYSRATDGCGWQDSLKRGVLGFPLYENLWSRLKYLFKR